MPRDPRRNGDGVNVNVYTQLQQHYADIFIREARTILQGTTANEVTNTPPIVNAGYNAQFWGNTLPGNLAPMVYGEPMEHTGEQIEEIPVPLVKPRYKVGDELIELESGEPCKITYVNDRVYDVIYLRTNYTTYYYSHTLESKRYFKLITKRKNHLPDWL